MIEFVVAYSKWCALGWTALILSILALWCYIDRNKPESGNDDRWMLRIALLLPTWLFVTMILLSIGAAL